MRRFVWLPVLLAVALVATPALGQGVPGPVNNLFDKDVPARFPDLDQNRDYDNDGAAETTWCAPTAAANSVWYFGNAGYPELIPNVGGNIANADALITALGNAMGTVDPNGTTIPNCISGLQTYFNNNTTTPFTVKYNTAFTLPDPNGKPSAQNLWNWMCAELENCEDVLPIIWMPGPDGQPVIPNPYEPEEVDGTVLDSVTGHLVTMTAYSWPMAGATIDIHDPDDAAVGVGHVFPPVPAGSPGKVTYNVSLVGMGGNWPWTALLLTDPLGLGNLNNACIVGAIVASPVPEPSVLLLLAPGLGLLALRRRKK